MSSATQYTDGEDGVADLGVYLVVEDVNSGLQMFTCRQSGYRLLADRFPDQKYLGHITV